MGNFDFLWDIKMKNGCTYLSATQRNLTVCFLGPITFMETIFLHQNKNLHFLNGAVTQHSLSCIKCWFERACYKEDKNFFWPEFKVVFPPDYQ